MLSSRLASFAGFAGAVVIAGAVVLASAVALGAAPAYAANLNDPVTIRVSVADLNMTSDVGAQEALARIRHAAKEICGDSGVGGLVAEQIESHSCVVDAVERAVANADQPTLTAVSQGQHVADIALSTH